MDSFRVVNVIEKLPILFVRRRSPITTKLHFFFLEHANDALDKSPMRHTLDRMYGKVRLPLGFLVPKIELSYREEVPLNKLSLYSTDVYILTIKKKCLLK